MSKIWFLENVNLFKTLCPHKFSAYKDCHNFSLYTKSDYIYFEEDASAKVYLISAPIGFTFPLDLAGGKAVISIELDLDNSPAPFLLKPLVGDIPANAVDHVTYDLGQNLNFPTGAVSR